MTSSDSAAVRYQRRIDRFTAEHQQVQQRWSLLANVRLVLFILLALFLWQWYSGDSGLVAAGVLVTVAVLVPVLVVHRRLRATRDDLARMVTVNERGQNRAALNWDSDIPQSPLSLPDPAHPFARDLNVVGAASLLRRIGTPATVAGWRTLQDWLLHPAEPAEILERQAAVDELARHIDLRQRVEQAALLGTTDPDTLDDLLRWAESRGRSPQASVLLALAWLGPIALVLAIIAQAAGWIPWPLWVFALAFNLLLSQLAGGAMAREVGRVGAVAGALDGYRAIVAHLALHQPASPMMARIHAALFDGGDGAAARIRRLSRVTSFIMPRGSLLYIPLQMATAWDIHIAAALDRWRDASGPDLRRWLDLVGDWEAIAALSVLRWDHPDWALPEVSPHRQHLAGHHLCHPLLADTIAVGNDVAVGPAGTFLFVTGSNMSGKSTLLRAIGANAVLAQAGAPVAATAMSLPPVRVVTTMRVEDSLAHGVSFFLAELQRLKQVVDAADMASGRPVLYLLDEILQGTNTSERQIASRRVLHHLTTTTAIGAVSSHDLTLIEGSNLESAAVAVHFSEQFSDENGEATMSFDYRLRPGLATSSNALALMEVLGFPED